MIIYTNIPVKKCLSSNCTYVYILYWFYNQYYIGNQTSIMRNIYLGRDYYYRVSILTYS